MRQNTLRSRNNWIAWLFNLAREAKIVTYQRDFATKLADTAVSLGRKAAYSPASMSRLLRKSNEELSDQIPVIEAFVTQHLQRSDEAKSLLGRISASKSAAQTASVRIRDSVEGLWLIGHFGLSKRKREQAIPYEEVRMSILSFVRKERFSYAVTMIGPTSEWEGTLEIRDGLGFCTLSHVRNHEKMALMVRSVAVENRIYNDEDLWTEGILLCGARGMRHQLSPPIVGTKVIMHKVRLVDLLDSPSEDIVQHMKQLRKDIIKYWRIDDEESIELLDNLPPNLKSAQYIVKELVDLWSIDPAHSAVLRA